MPIIEVEEVLDLFVGYLKSANMAEKTIEDYRKEMVYFVRFLEEKGIKGIGEVSVHVIDLYNKHLMDKGNVPSTRSKKMSVIRKFFHYCHSRKYITDNPAEAIDPIKLTEVDAKKRETLTLNESVKLIKKIEKNSVNKEKNLCIVKVFLYCGVRVSELCELKVKDLDTKEKTLLIKGKGRTYRLVPLNDELIKDLKTYLSKRKAASEYLFTKKQTELPMKPRAVHALIKHHVGQSNIDKSIGCHSLRRTSATNYLRSGVSERYIQLYLGHKHISTTMKYINPEIEEVMDRLRENNGLEKALKKENRKSKKKG